MRPMLWVVMMVAAAACSTATATVTPTPDAEYLAPDFQAIALDGTPYQLSALRGQWVILNFWATWCQPCIEEMPALQAIATQYEERITILGLNMDVDLSSAEIASFTQQHGITFPILIEVDNATRSAYQVINMPQTVLVAPNGEIMWRQFGPVDEAEFSDRLASFITRAVPANDTP